MSTIWFDLDGTLYDLYNQPSWLEMLNNENGEVYSCGNSLVNVTDFTNAVKALKKQGYKFGVITWLSRDCSRKYGNSIRYHKLKWLDKTFPNLFDVVHIVKYGTDKSKFATSENDILFDDDANVCCEWLNSGHTPVCLINQPYDAHERWINECEIVGNLQAIAKYGIDGFQW